MAGPRPGRPPRESGLITPAVIAYGVAMVLSTLVVVVLVVTRGQLEDGSSAATALTFALVAGVVVGAAAVIALKSTAKAPVAATV